MENLIAAWLRRSRVRRNEIFGQNDPYPQPVAAEAKKQAETAAPGMVGSSYREGGKVLIAVNPAGGRSNYHPTKGDQNLYNAFESFAAKGAYSEFEHANKLFIEEMQVWPVYSQHIG